MLISDNMCPLLVVPKPGGWQHRDFSSARPAVFVDFLQGREAEESGVDGCEADLLERRVVPNVGERARSDIGRPGDSIHAGFKTVIFGGAIEVPVLARQIGEAGNPM